MGASRLTIAAVVMAVLLSACSGTDGTTVYVADGEYYDIQAFDVQGNYLRTFGADAGYNCVAADASGRVYVTNPATSTGAPSLVAIFDAGGAEITSTQLGMPTLMPLQLAVDAAGNGYVPLQVDHFPWTDQGVLEFDPAGQVVGMLSDGGEFLGVAPDGGTLYVTRGSQLDNTQWTFVRAYVLPVS